MKWQTPRANLRTARWLFIRRMVRDLNFPLEVIVAPTVREPAARLDYVDCINPDTLRPVAVAQRGVHLALAVFIGKTRLIDNLRLD